MRGFDRERISFGRYPDLSLSEARTEAKKLLASKPEAKVETFTFREARTQFLEQYYRDKGIRTKNEATRHLTKHFAKLDKKPLPVIEDGEIKICLDRLFATRSEQLHAHRFAGCFFRWCTRPPRRYLKHSPMEKPSSDRIASSSTSQASRFASLSSETSCRTRRHSAIASSTLNHFSVRTPLNFSPSAF